MKVILNQVSSVLGLDLRYLLRGGLAISFMYASLAMIGFLVSVVLARQLSVEAYGQYQFLLSFLAIISVFALPGMNIAALKSAVSGNMRAVEQATRYSFLASLAATPVFLGSASFFFFVRHDSAIALIFILLSTLAPFYHAFNTWYVYYAAEEQFDQVAWRSCAVALIPAVGVILVALNGWGALPLILTHAALFSGMNFVFYVIGRRSFGVTSSPHAEPISVRYGFAVTAQKFVYGLAETLPPLIIAWLFAFREVAVFQVAFFSLSIFSSYLGALVAIYVPRLFVIKNLAHGKILLNSILGGLAGYLTLIVFLRFFFLDFYGEAYTESLRLANIIAPLVLILPLKTYLVNFFSTREKNLTIILVYALANIAALSIFFLEGIRDAFILKAGLYLYVLNALTVFPLLTVYLRWIAAEKTASI